MDLQSYNRWDEYTLARDEMFGTSDTQWAPWYVARSDDKRPARFNMISHLLSRIKYEKVFADKVKLPKRQTAKKYKTSNSPFKFIHETY